jgi:acyl-CoA reductase-like NAD-dependent aldehyde dehydrogenase
MDIYKQEIFGPVLLIVELNTLGYQVQLKKAPAIV